MQENNEHLEGVHSLFFSHLYEHGRHERGHVPRQPEGYILCLLQQPSVGVSEKNKKDTI